MPFYRAIAPGTRDGKRTLKRLLALRTQLDDEIPRRTLDETLLIATWNLREFGGGKCGGRLDEAILYIAEIIARFDLVALQEVNKDLAALDRLKRTLGRDWDYIVTDTTEGGAGNRERMAFIFDTRKVTFGRLAGEVVLPPKRVKQGKKAVYQPTNQLWRTPGICGFKSGWARFMLATVHIAWGDSKPAPAARVKEIEAIAKFLYDRSLDEDAWARNIVLLGDFNIFDTDDATFKALAKGHFVVPPELQCAPSNAGQTRHFDQIAFRRRPGSLEPTGQAGVFNYYRSVFRQKDESAYKKAMGASYLKTAKGKARDAAGKSRYYKSTYRTFQMSDHLPMWVEVRIDHSTAYLEDLLARKKAR